MRTGYSYLRFSTKEQSKGDSFRRQTDRTAAVCQAFDLVLDDTFNLKDLGVSAFKGKNLAEGSPLNAFLIAAKAGKVKKNSVLIVESLDRLSRNDIDECLPLFLDIIKS